MRRPAYLLLAFFLVGSPAPGQGPGQTLSPAPLAAQQPAGIQPRPSVTQPAQAGSAAPNSSPAGDLLAFDPRQTEVRWVNHDWQLLAGGALLKNFGPHQAEAWEALRLIRTLNLTQRGTVGSPRPILEYWLSNGQAPQSLGGGVHVLPLDQASLRLEQIQGQWCVRDDRRLLFNFGVQQADAATALDVLRRYGFTQVGYLGWPTPLMMYFLKGPGGTAAMTPPTLQPRTPGNQPGNTGPAAQPGGRTPPGALLQAQLLAAGTHQLAPPQTSAAAVVRFDPNRLEVKRDQDFWRLAYGQQVLASFASQQEARQAQDVVRSFNFTEAHFLGRPGASFAYFLVHGQPPRGLRFGVASRPFQPERVAVLQFGNDWVLCDGHDPLENFGPNRDQAQQLAEAIQHYHFDHLCRVGPAGPLSMPFLVRMH